MRRCFEEIDLSGKRLAKKCGVSHSQIYMARKHNVGPDNAEKIARRMALMLGLRESAWSSRLKSWAILAITDLCGSI
jgi:hypothetical protein